MSSGVKAVAGDLKHGHLFHDDLFIYYLKGPVEETGTQFGPDFIGNWEEDGFSFLFFSGAARSRVDAYLEKHPENCLLDSYQMPYEQWQGGRIGVMELGPFIISPPWERASGVQEGNRKGDEIQIDLDPGVVFGNCLHETTKDCLDALAMIFSEYRIQSALDLGTGTGILALAAAKLGCKSCTAVDFNLLACRTALNNVRLNGLEDNILVARGRAEDFIGFKSDLIIANIHYDVMKSLIRSEGFFKTRWFILSGLLRTQARQIADTLSRRSVKIIKRWEQEGIWHTFLGETVR